MTRLLLLLIVTIIQSVPAEKPGSPDFTAGVARLASAATNEGRFDALMVMLNDRKLTFTAEPFSIPKPARQEPRTEGRNVVVSFGEGTQEIVIGAHYDAARLADGSLSKGAVDNAASSVLLVHLADALRSEKLKVRVSVVWFDMEELGLVGSQQYIQKHGSSQIAAMVNFDINAYGNTIMFAPSAQGNAAQLRRSILQTCALEDVSCVGFPQLPTGDDRPFIKAGIPTVSIATLPALEAHQLWLLLNGGASAGLTQGTTPPVLRTIHTAEDTPDKVNEETMAMVHKFVLSLVRNLAGR